jgi:hypothetical protein
MEHLKNLLLAVLVVVLLLVAYASFWILVGLFVVYVLYTVFSVVGDTAME